MNDLKSKVNWYIQKCKNHINKHQTLLQDQVSGHQNKKNKKSNVHQDHEYVLYTLQKSLDILTGNREHITHQLKYEHVLLFCHCKLNYGSFYSFLSSQLWWWWQQFWWYLKKVLINPFCHKCPWMSSNIAKIFDTNSSFHVK